ncbi:hypothetical protein SLS62_008413 [Diatrype stigma]|uniref:Heterokaryon incompatibility domain-containing protein n=1 Tax=Diatrype stigma TaxID=117547 RepID=A0AAN9UJQ1_9PEZI
MDSSDSAYYSSIEEDLKVRKPTRPRPRAERRQRLEIRSPPPRDDKERVKLNWARVIRKAQFSLYKYEPIQEDRTRLMALDPSEDPKGDIHVTLIPVPIAMLHRFPYEALSYHWGESESENPVYVKTGKHEQGERMSYADDDMEMTALRLYVKDNLYEALRHLRQKTDRILVWADGICMDQGNSAELGAQVPNMSQIYSQANGVCIWLGAADKGRRTDRAMRFITKVVETQDIHTLIQKDQVQNWKDLIYLINCSWFSRRWVIQEVALARIATVHCGSMELNWSDFVDAISIFDLYFQDIRKLFEDRSREYHTITDLKPLGAKILVDELSNVFLRGADRRLFEPIKNLELLVSTLAPFETTDPRDTIFALLNIASETSRVSIPRLLLPASAAAGGDHAAAEEVPPPTADYTKNLLEVYVGFVEWVVSRTGSLDIVCRHWALPERTTVAIMYEELVTLPSWIKLVLEAPYGHSNQGINGRKNGDSFVGLPGARCYNASHGMPPTVRFGMKSPRPPPSSRLEAAVRFAGGLFAAAPPKASGRVDNGGGGGGHRTMMTRPNPLSPTSPSSSNSPSNPLLSSPTPLNLDPSLNTSSFLMRGARWIYSQLRGWLLPGTAEVPSSRDSRMYVRGFVLGGISWSSSPMPHGIVTRDALERLGWSPDGSDEYDSVPDTVWRTLVADRGPDGRHPPSWYPRACLRCLAKVTSNGHIVTGDILGESPPRIMHDYIKRMQAVTWNRVIFDAAFRRGRETTEKLIGVGPPGTAQGDLVCILYGCSVPCILRPWVSSNLFTYQQDQRRRPIVGEKPDFYEFVGESFVYGKMDGQAISGMDRNELLARSEDFCLV